MKRFLRSFALAFRGIRESVLTGRNLRIQIVIGAYTLATAPFFLNTRTEWAILLMMVALVLISEIFNTALELLVDQASPSYSTLAKAAKDAAAGAVLLCALFSLIIAGLLFLKAESFGRFFTFCREHLWYPLLLIAGVPLSVLFIVKVKFIKKDR